MFFYDLSLPLRLIGLAFSRSDLGREKKPRLSMRNKKVAKYNTLFLPPPFSTVIITACSYTLCKYRNILYISVVHTQKG